MAATAKLDMRLAWPAVCALIAQEGAQPAKPDCRWVKLATFGQHRTAKGCLRHDANVRQVFGIEGDYDDEVMTPEEAIERLERHQLKALVYTS
ncbi:hypothetical protein CCR95_23740 [Thiocystis minor]|uniref:hypothetical protein n=1 Tax=Thiocystis minor TaxID=61597 RepID=UPI0019136652|nr:hypothetical protein [Thiocystis minor]MBK5966997.1 hypothetical protein [Thiocystis minor]